MHLKDGVETIHTLTCTTCGKQISRKRIAYLERLADKEGWTIGDGRDSGTYCPDHGRTNMKHDFDIPQGLSPEIQQVAETIAETIRKDCGPNASGGGCQLFYTPSEWKDRGEEYGTNSKLVIVHDGGDQAPFFNWAYCEYTRMEKMVEALKPLGFYPEQCTCWYSAIYAI